jgi:PIN domain nuclease of toxin-antitoxin system
VTLLLDTHVFLWWIGDEPRLGRQARAAVSEAGDAVHVSAASVWEIAIKMARGRLRLPRDEPLSTLIESEGFNEIPVTSRHAEVLLRLPLAHGDPFDRLIVAQAMAEEMTLVTADRTLEAYKIPILRT